MYTACIRRVMLCDALRASILWNIWNSQNVSNSLNVNFQTF